MTDEEISILRFMNANRHEEAKENNYQQYIKLDDFLIEQYKKNTKHHHFKTKKSMKAAMLNDFNPYNTFSWGKINPVKETKEG